MSRNSPRLLWIIVPLQSNAGKNHTVRRRGSIASSYSLSKIFDVNQTFPRSALRGGCELPCIANVTAVIGDQVIAVLDHVQVRPDNRCPPRYGFHAGRIKRTVEMSRSFQWLLIRVIGQQKCKSHLRMSLFYAYNCICSHMVESAVVSHHKILHAIPRYMTLHRFGQNGKQFIRRVPVSDKEADRYSTTSSYQRYIPYIGNCWIWDMSHTINRKCEYTTGIDCFRVVVLV